MNIAHLTTFYSPHTGGPFYSVTRLAEELAGLPENQVTLFGLKNDQARAAAAGSQTLTVRLFDHVGPRAFGFAPGYAQGVAQSRPDVIHVNGLWMYPSLVSMRCRLRQDGPRLISPRGRLDAWALARSPWKKRIARMLFEDRHLKQASCLHAVASAEASAIRAAGLTNPICVVPNAVDWPERMADPATGSPTTLLFLGRLHPKKGVSELLQGWAAVRTEAERAGWRLSIAGAGAADYERELARFVDDHDLADSVDFHGACFGPAKQRLFQGAHAFVLPSFSEGQPVAVLEAWSYGLPVVMTRACNLAEGFAAEAAIETGHTGEAVADALRTLFSMSGRQRAEMGIAGRRLIERGFSWRQRAADMQRVYEWLLERGRRPDCVVLA